MNDPMALGRFFLATNPEVEAPHDRTLWFVALALGPLSALVRGYAPGLYNGVVHLPLIRQRLDPSLYPGDLLLAGHAVYPSIVWDAVTLLAPLAGMWTAMFWFFVGQQVLLHYAVLRFSWRMGLGWLGVVVASLQALLVVAPGLGGSQWSGVSLMHTTVGFSLLVVALVEATQGRWWRSAAWWWAGGLVHLPNAVFALPMIVGAAVGCLGAGAAGPRPMQRAIGAALVVGAGLVVLGWRVVGGATGPLPTMDELRAMVPDAVAMHLFLGQHFQSVESQRRLLTFVLQGVIAVWLMAAARLDRRDAWPWFAAVVGGAVMVSAAVFTTEVIESVWLARLQRLRTADFLHFVFLMTPLALAGRWAAAATRLHPLGVAPFVALVFLGSGHWAGEPEWWMAALGIVAASHVAAARGWSLPAAWSGGLDERARVGVLLLGVAWPAAAVAIHGEILEQGWRRELHKASPWAREWRDAQEASNRKLPPHQTILTPPHERGWRNHSRHSPFLELSDNVGTVLNPAISAEYHRRALALDCDEERMRDWSPQPTGLYAWGTGADYERVMRAEGLRYAVVGLNIEVPGARQLWDGTMLQLIDIGPAPIDSATSEATGS